VLVPGTILLSDIAAIVIAGDQPAQLPGRVTEFAAWTQQLGAVGQALLLLDVLTAAYFTGLLSRVASFWLAAVARRLGALGEPSPTLHDILQGLRQTYGDQVTDSFGDATILASAIRANLEMESANDRRRVGPWDTWLRGHAPLDQDALTTVFAYCKAWLRHWAPDLTVDRHELDINIAFSSIPPIWVTAVAIAKLSATPVGLVPWLLLIAATFFLLRWGADIERVEKRDALDRFVVARSIATTAPGHRPDR